MSTFAFAAYVTNQAWLKLYEYLRELLQSVLYCETDSLFYIHKVSENPKLKSVIVWASSQTS